LANFSAIPCSGWDNVTARALLRDMFDAAVSAADPVKILAAHLPSRPRGRCIVVGAGKAAAMARAVDAAWPDVDLRGAVVVPYGYALAAGRIAVLEAAHPVPDANSTAAGRTMLDLVSGLSPDDLVLALVSGGGSSVLASPAEGLTLADKQRVNRVLLASGLDIRTMNAIRRRVSAIKGGRLAAAAAPARVVTLTISDIPGDDVSAIASGPTIADPDPARDLSPFAARYREELGEAVYACLVSEPPPAPAITAEYVRLIATPRQALDAASAIARTAGIEVVSLGDDLESESSEVGRDMARIARSSGKTPRILLSGGETTVTIGDGATGRGGRNTEFALALALELDGRPGVWCLAADTDGEDGTSGGGAGAFVAPDTLARARAAGVDPAESLRRHDSGSFFERVGDLLVTGPTLTNVNDFRAVLIAH